MSEDLHLVISDLEGHVLQEDAKPTEWSDEGFKVYKRRRDTEHFFGLGDKPGPLDRTGESLLCGTRTVSDGRSRPIRSIRVSRSSWE